MRPIDVQHSGWECGIEADGALRLGLRYVDGLRKSAGERLEAAAPFASIGDLAKRAELHRDELECLSEIGACAGLGLARREALWQASALGDGPLASTPRETPSPLREMSELEQTLSDYRGTGLTLGPQLMSHLRAHLDERGVTVARDLPALPNGRWTRVAGVVIVRQRPGSAKGFLFITLEDETGMSNSVIFPDVYQANRTLIQRAKIMLIEGPLESREGVIHVRATRFEELNVADKLPPSHDFR